MRRRKFVALVGTTGAISIAGCTDGSTEADAQTTPEDDGGERDQTGASTPEETEPPTETSTPDQSAEAERNAIGYPSEYIEVRDVEYNRPTNSYSGPSITGVVDNVSGEELSYVAIEADAFNENDEQIAEALDNTTDLREGKSWRFEAEFWDVEERNIDYWMGRAEVSNY